MNRKDIAKRVAGAAGIARQDAEAAAGAVFAPIVEALARGEDVAVAAFGTFARKERPARALAAHISAGNRTVAAPGPFRPAANAT